MFIKFVYGFTTDFNIFETVFGMEDKYIIHVRTDNYSVRNK